jgi:actin-related protein 5
MPRYLEIWPNKLFSIHPL